MADRSTEIMVKALDGLFLRATIAADNITNAGSQGFKPGRVPFEAALAAAARQGEEALRNFNPEVVRDSEGVASGGARPAESQLELFTMTGATGRYGAVINLLSRQIQLHTLAVSRSR